VILVVGDLVVIVDEGDGLVIIAEDNVAIAVDVEPTPTPI
jgi:hypothetical protein